MLFSEKYLDLPLEDVLRAWDFWEGKGIIEKILLNADDKINYNVKFLNLKQLYIKNNFNVLSNKKEPTKDQYSCTTEDLLDANKIPLINKMFNQIDYIIRRPLVPMEKQKILSWVHDYNMNPDVIEKAFFYAVERKGVRKINYVEGIIRNWYDQGLTNLEAITEHFKRQDTKYYGYQKVMKSLGLDNRPITQGEIKIIDKWFEQYNFSIEIILKGCEGSSRVANPNVNYIDAILTSWYEKGVKTFEDIEEKDKPKEKKEIKVVNSIPKRSTQAKTRFHNFEQRTSKYTSEQLEDIARRKREEHYLKAKGES